jgi:hypothetical protein
VASSPVERKTEATKETAPVTVPTPPESTVQKIDPKSLEGRALKERAKRLEPAAPVAEKGKNFEGRYVQAALEPVEQAWEKAKEKYADHQISWGKDTASNRRTGVRVNMHDPEGKFVASLEVKNYSNDKYQVIAKGSANGTKNMTGVHQVLDVVSDFATGKKMAEGRLLSGQVYNPDGDWVSDSFTGKDFKSSEVTPHAQIRPDTAKPEGFKEDKLLVKVPDDGTFVVPNNPVAIDNAMKAAEKFPLEKFPDGGARRVPKSPDEFNVEKYITGLEKEVADIQHKLKKAVALQKPQLEEELKAARENLAEAKKETPESLGKKKSGEAGFATMGAINPIEVAKNLKTVYDQAVKEFINGKLKIGDKYFKVAEHDPTVAHALHIIDNAPMDIKRHAERNIANVTEGLSEDQVRLAAMMVDSDARDFLEAKHPDEYDKAINDPQVMEAVKKFDPMWKELTADRLALGWSIRRNLSVTDEQDDGFHVVDRDGNDEGVFKTEKAAQKYVDENGEPEPHLKRTYPEHSKNPLPGETGFGDLGTGQPHEKGLRPAKMDKKQRLASAEYFYEHGRKDFSGYEKSYKQTKFAVAKQALYDDFTKNATKWTAGTAQPPSIEYNGKTYHSPDIVAKAREGGDKKLQPYAEYDPSRGDKMLIMNPAEGWATRSTGRKGIGPDDRFLGPKPVVDAMENYDATRGGEAGKLRHFFQEQIVGLFGPMVHVNNILRRVGQTAGLGTFDPRSWPSIAKVIASPELRARVLSGVDDATIAMLSREGAWVDWGDIGQMNKYIGGNLNPANWVRSTGKGILFDPKFAGGWGGLDPKARVVIADYFKEHFPKMSDQEIAAAVNDGLGNYNRANWTERQRTLAKFVLFPGWDTASAKWFLRHPFRAGFAGALVVLAVNQALKYLKKNKGDDSTDLQYVHIGDRKYSTGLINDNMGSHIMAPVLGAIQAKLRGESMAAGTTEGAMKGTSALAGTLAGPVVEMVADQVYNRKFAGAAQELVKPQDRYTPGTWAPNVEMEKRLAFAALKGAPALNRFINQKGEWDWAQGIGGGVLGVTNFKYGAEERLRANESKAAIYAQTMNNLARTDPEAAAKFVSDDPMKATYLMFHQDLGSLTKDLKEIDTQIERVRGSDLPAADRDKILVSLKDNRNLLLKASDGLNDALEAAKAQARNRQADYWKNATAK